MRNQRARPLPLGPRAPECRLPLHRSGAGGRCQAGGAVAADPRTSRERETGTRICNRASRHCARPASGICDRAPRPRH